jgi:SAM-dependent methyltransferase
MPSPATPFDQVHETLVLGRRVHALCGHVSGLISRGSHVLDVGSGDGRVAAELMRRRPDVRVEGIDVLVRRDAVVPTSAFDGKRIPYADGTIDTVLILDVLHHTDDPAVLLAEARRVAREAILIKDHACDGVLAGPTLRLMDWVGNARFGVRLPHTYWPRRRWLTAFADLDLEVEVWRARLGLYPVPARWVFERSLHFLARLRPRTALGAAHRRLDEVGAGSQRG